MKTNEFDKEVLELVRELNSTVSVCKQWAVSNIPPDGLSQARMQILLYLNDNGSSPMRDLNEYLGTSATNITGLIDGLESEGFVLRTPDPNDRRITRIEITPSGIKIAQKEWSKYEQSCASSFTDLPPAKRKQILQALKDIRQLVQK